MKKNWIIVGLVTAAIMVASLGAVLAQDDAKVQDPALEEPMEEFDAIWDYIEDEDANYLITKEQMGEIRNETHLMIREQIRENLAEYGMPDEEILELEENMDAIHEMEKEVRETISELRDEGISRDEIKTEVEPLITEIQELRTLIKDKLNEYDVVLPGRMGRRDRMGPDEGCDCCGSNMGKLGGQSGIGRGSQMGRPGNGGPGMGGPGMGDGDFSGPRP